MYKIGHANGACDIHLYQELNVSSHVIIRMIDIIFQQLEFIRW